MKILLSLPLLLPLVTAQLPTPQACHDIHHFLARGTDESYPSFLGYLVDGVCSPILNAEVPDGTSCGYQDIIYPATFHEYCDSVLQGSTYAKAALKEYADRCPGSKTVLVGWSQGAQVLGDALAGGGGHMPIVECEMAKSLPISSESPAAKQIKAIVFFGDTRHVKGEPYNAGSGASFNGVAPRTSEMLANLKKYSDVMQSYCNFGDPYCATLSQPDANNTAQHEPDAYKEKHMEDAIGFVRRQIAIEYNT
ncbi:alpha/beta-hydrolase [Ascobolus immersus RN42]|uniref:Alpha/beta-hydrolase n=1 Tax=Ascobolus immersus RN42 TaxID=1160509 RepID=A0A3N4I1P4_ASCIM|nr:alpha/beta-hydrolase [Ascobolus immersus RN42]